MDWKRFTVCGVWDAREESAHSQEGTDYGPAARNKGK